jgi:phage regulator Rha-like protein
MNEIIPIEVIQQKIFLLRGHKVMLDTDLADLYGVTVKRLNEQVKRNVNRFPQDFMFQLSEEENQSLRSHFATLKIGRGHHRKYLPYVFTEHGTIMLANVLNSPTSVQASIQVVRAFVKLRQILSTHKELAHKLIELERKIEDHDEEIHTIFEAIRQLMAPPEPNKKQIGFGR